MTARGSETWWAAYDGDHETWIRVRPHELVRYVLDGLLEEFEQAETEDNDAEPDSGYTPAWDLVADVIRLRERRAELGLTQDQAAKLVGVSSRAYCDWERGKAVPAARRRAALEAAFWPREEAP